MTFKEEIALKNKRNAYTKSTMKSNTHIKTSACVRKRMKYKYGVKKKQVYLVGSLISEKAFIYEGYE